MAVYVSKAAERAYVRRALSKYPNEHLEVLWGKLTRSGDILVCAFVGIDQKCGPSVAEYSSFEWAEQNEEIQKHVTDSLDDHARDAESHGLVVVGKIHSHPYEHDNCDEMPSYTDLKDDVEEGVLVTGICCIGKRESGRKFTKVGYWPPLRKHETKYTN